MASASPADGSSTKRSQAENALRTTSASVSVTVVQPGLHEDDLAVAEDVAVEDREVDRDSVSATRPEAGLDHGHLALNPEGCGLEDDVLPRCREVVPEAADTLESPVDRLEVGEAA